MASQPPEPAVLDPNHEKKRGWNSAIEGLRGFSASLVVVTHLYAMSVTAGFVKSAPAGVLRELLTRPGPFGVVLFFMISGYLIVQSLIKHGDAAEFLKNRVIRIYPVFLVLHVTIFTLGPLFHYDWMGRLRHEPVQWALNFFSNLFFLPGLLPLPIAQKNAWSLSFEALFYVLASLGFVAWVNRTRKPWRAGLVGLGFGVASVGFLGRYPSAASFFLAGALVYYYSVRHKTQFWDRSVAAPLGLAGLLVAFCTWRNVSPDLNGWKELRTSDLVLPIIAWGSGLLCFASVASQRGWFARLLQVPMVTHLGRISYSMYLIHPFVLEGVRVAVGKVARVGHLSGPLECVGFVVVGVPATVFVSGLSYRYVEVGVGRWLAGRLQPQK